MPLLPRFFAHAQRVEDLQRIAAIVLEAEVGRFQDSNGKVRRSSAGGFNRDRARGVPIVGPLGGGGASPGSNPLAELLRKEGRRRQ